MIEFIGEAFHFIGQLLIEAILEFLIQGLGYVLCKPLKKDINPDGALVTVVGIVFWVLFAVGAWQISEYLHST